MYQFFLHASIFRYARENIKVVKNLTQSCKSIAQAQQTFLNLSSRLKLSIAQAQLTILNLSSQVKTKIVEG